MLLSELLKKETATQHKNTENVPLQRRLMQQDFTQAEYLKLLEAWWLILSVFENQFSKSPLLHNIIQDLDKRYRLPLIEKDLKAFGKLPPNISPPHSPINTASAEDYIGYLYVLEGSTLGGQFIEKKLLTHPWITQNHINFYQGHHKNTRSMWLEFKRQLDSWGNQNKTKHLQVVAAAQKAFNYIGNVIQQHALSKLS